MAARAALRVAVILSIIWAVQVATRPAQLILFDTDSLDLLRVTGLAIAVGILGLVAGSLPWLGAGRTVVLAVGLLEVLACGRRAALPPLVTVGVTTCWLLAAPVGALLVQQAIYHADSRAMPRSWAWCWTATVVSAVAASVADGGRGLGATLGHVAAEPRSIARVLLLVHCVMWVTLGVVLAWQTRARQSAGPRTESGAAVRERNQAGASVTFMAVASVWWVALAWERAVHTFPLDTFRDLYRDTYRPWAATTVVYLPLLATGALLVASAWTAFFTSAADRPNQRFAQRDPIEALRDDLAGWTGDPSLRLAFADQDGLWLEAVDSVDASAGGYDRAVTVVRRNGQPIARLEHDIALSQAPEVLRTAAQLSGLAFDANRLLALADDQLRRARQLAERLLTADLDVRADVAATMDTGALRRVAAAADSVRDGDRLVDVADTLRDATTSVRLLARRLHPPELDDGGLLAVFPGRRGVPLRRLHSVIEVTAYQLSADDEKAWFQDDTTVIRVHRSTPLQDAALLDRIDALGGRVESDGPTGGPHLVVLPVIPNSRRS
jgi:signal transduction histidine kinase